MPKSQWDPPKVSRNVDEHSCVGRAHQHRQAGDPLSGRTCVGSLRRNQPAMSVSLGESTFGRPIKTVMLHSGISSSSFCPKLCHSVCCSAFQRRDVWDVDG